MLKVGLIGCGSITKQRHAYEYSLNDNVEIAGFFDLKKERAQELANIFGGKVYESVDEMLNDSQIDAVSVCVANAFHAENSIKALDAGKHVLCEKPMATTIEECEAMLEAANRNNKHLLIGQNQRLTPTHQYAKELINSGKYGKVISFQTTFGHGGPESWSADQSANTWFFKKDKAAFGSMADLGIHKLDLIRYLVGDDYDSVYSKQVVLDKKFPDGSPIEVDDNSVEILQFKNGAFGTVTTSWTVYGEEVQVTTLFLTKGIMKLYADPDFSLIVVRGDGQIDKYQLDVIQTNDDEQQASSGVIDEFVDAILQDRPSVLDASDIINSMRAVFACVESNKENKEIKVD